MYMGYLRQTMKPTLDKYITLFSFSGKLANFTVLATRVFLHYYINMTLWFN